MRAVKTITGLAVAVLLAVATPAGADILPVGLWPLNEGKGAVANDLQLSLARHGAVISAFI